MKIVLLCERVERLKNRRYRCVFRQLPHGQDLIEAVLDIPARPGALYNVLLCGEFPSAGLSGGLRCSTDVGQFTCRETLTGVDTQAAAELEKEHHR